MSSGGIPPGYAYAPSRGGGYELQPVQDGGRTTGVFSQGNPGKLDLSQKTLTDQMQVSDAKSVADSTKSAREYTLMAQGKPGGQLDMKA
ncbi:MAG TPA: hypothetical protein V6C52_01750 [Coleofasciculaceae cyanobacterium]|jgi:hypothetical protein